MYIEYDRKRRNYNSNRDMEINQRLSINNKAPSNGEVRNLLKSVSLSLSIREISLFTF